MKSISTSPLPAPFHNRGITNKISCASKIVIVAKKGSNKSPKKPSKEAEPSAPRITSNVKQNLQFIKLSKEFQKNDTARPSTSYRRKKVEKEERRKDTEETEPYQTDLGVGIPIVLVDGYNVCGYWPMLKKYFLGGKLDIARQLLIDELITFSSMREMKVVVVFDAEMSGRRSRKEQYGSIEIVYSAETCADIWIENKVASLREEGCTNVWVVTSDRDEREGAYGAGAFVWSSAALVSEIKSCHKELEKMQNKECTVMKGRLLMHNLDPKVVSALKTLRNQLSQNR